VAFAGASAHVFSIMQTTTVDIGSSAQLLGPTGQRVYLNTTSDNPSDIPAWPANVTSTSPAAISIRPALYELTQGNLDSALRAFLMGAPAAPAAPSLVGMWHEASTQGPNASYAPYFNSLDQNFPGQGGAHGLLTKAQAYVQGKAHDWGANVKVGAIEVNQATDDTSAWNNLNQWMAPDLDFYACDTYDGKDGTSVPADFLNAFQYVANKLGPNAAVGMTETNSRFPGRRPYWFTAAWSWLMSNGYTSDATCYLSFWNTTGKESGDWITDDWATIDALYAIFQQSSP
jgi:hypothetical protein